MDDRGFEEMTESLSRWGDHLATTDIENSNLEWTDDDQTIAELEDAGLWTDLDQD